MNRHAALSAGLWLSLGSWIGAWGFFAFVVSRLAFQVLPGPTAGDLAGALLTQLHYGGALAAFVAAGCAAGLGRSRWLVVAAVALGVVCLGSELLLTPQVAAVRPSTVGAASTVETAERFKLLHGLSLGLFMGVHLGSFVLFGCHAWAQSRD